MVTKQDLVEAHAFSRRRLVTAFVAGAAGARVSESTQPLRTIVGGLALAGLLLAAAAIMRAVATSGPETCALDAGAFHSTTEEASPAPVEVVEVAQVTGPGR